MKLRAFSLALSLIVFIQPTFAQVDTTKSAPHFRTVSWVAPSVLTLYGVSSFFIQPIRNVDTRWYHSINSSHVRNNQTIDDVLQYTPAITVYGLDVLGIKGKNNWKDQTIHLAVSQIVMNAIVRPTKILSNRLRPDGSEYSSFPSGHTSMAFVNAEFLWQEYKHRNKWLAASGYVAAATTGYLRMQHNRHWFSDIVAGAGIGILSTKLTYWAYPRLVRMVKKKRLPK
jgi:membrane-associated phospholipid phosphatase